MQEGGLGRGIYAAEVTHARRDLPVEESGRLDDAVLRQNFVTRVFVHAHWHQLRAQGMTAASLIAFHHAYEDLVAKHNAASCNSLERLASDLSQAIEETAERYQLTIPVGHDPGPDNSGSVLMRHYRTGGTPWTVIIGKDGFVHFNEFHASAGPVCQLIDLLRR